MSRKMVLGVVLLIIAAVVALAAVWVNAFVGISEEAAGAAALTVGVFFGPGIALVVAADRERVQ